MSDLVRKLVSFLDDCGWTGVMWVCGYFLPRDAPLGECAAFLEPPNEVGLTVPLEQGGQLEAGVLEAWELG